MARGALTGRLLGLYGTFRLASKDVDCGHARGATIPLFRRNHVIPLTFPIRRCDPSSLARNLTANLLKSIDPLPGSAILTSRSLRTGLARGSVQEARPDSCESVSRAPHVAATINLVAIAVGVARIVSLVVTGQN